MSLKSLTALGGDDSPNRRRNGRSEPRGEVSANRPARPSVARGQIVKGRFFPGRSPTTPIVSNRLYSCDEFVSFS